MLSGHDQRSARKDLVVNGHGNHALAEPETSLFYGEYEQRLAGELAELLKTGAAPGTAVAGVVMGPGNASDAAASASIQGPAMASPLPRPAPGGSRAFVPAAHLENDYAADDEEHPPLPYRWLHEPPPPTPS